MFDCKFVLHKSSNVNFAYLVLDVVTGQVDNCLWMESHAEASTADEGEDESGEPRQHHVRPAAEEFHENIELFSFTIDMCPK